MPLTEHERAVLMMERNTYAAMQEARTVLTEIIDLMQRDVARRDERILDLQSQLEAAYRRIGAQEWTVADLRRELAAANEAVAELQAMNERAQS